MGGAIVCSTCLSATRHGAVLHMYGAAAFLLATTITTNTTPLQDDKEAEEAPMPADLDPRLQVSCTATASLALTAAASC